MAGNHYLILCSEAKLPRSLVPALSSLLYHSPCSQQSSSPSLNSQLQTATSSSPFAPPPAQMLVALTPLQPLLYFKLLVWGHTHLNASLQTDSPRRWHSSPSAPSCVGAIEALCMPASVFMHIQTSVLPLPHRPTSQLPPETKSIQLPRFPYSGCFRETSSAPRAQPSLRLSPTHLSKCPVLTCNPDRLSCRRFPSTTCGTAARKPCTALSPWRGIA